MQTYIVQNGDTLYGISKQFGISVHNIKLANNKNDNTIVVGESLLIPSAATTTLYIVKVGDTLYSIAKRFNTTVSDLIRINNLKTNFLSIGQQLKIPINEDNSEYIIYTVRAGDSLYSIARRYGLTVNSLIKYNNLSSNILTIGQKLKIPNKNTESEFEDDLIIYIVKVGDTLYSIAKKYGMTVDKLIEINNLKSSILVPGQPLKIILVESNEIPFGASCYGEGYTEPAYITHVVVRGDNLYEIAKKYGVSVESIKKLNNLDSNLLNIGQILKIREVD